MTHSFLEEKGAQFWPDTTEADLQTLKLPTHRNKISNLLRQLFLEINNSLVQNTAARGAIAASHNDVPQTTSVVGRRGDHMDEPIDVDDQTSHGETPIDPAITQGNRDTNSLPRSFPQLISRTFECTDDPPTNEYDITDTNNAATGRGKSLPRAPEAPASVIGHRSYNQAESSAAAENRANVQRKNTQAIPMPKNAKKRVSQRESKRPVHPGFVRWEDVQISSEDSPSLSDESEDTHPCDSSRNDQSPSPPRLPTPPPRQAEGAAPVLEGSDGDLHMEDHLPNENPRPGGVDQSSDMSINLRISNPQVISTIGIHVQMATADE